MAVIAAKTVSSLKQTSRGQPSFHQPALGGPDWRFA